MDAGNIDRTPRNDAPPPPSALAESAQRMYETIQPLSMPSRVPLPELSRRLGPALLALNSARAERFRAGKLPPRFSLLDRLVLAALIDRHKAQGTLEELTPLHDSYWSSEEATVFFGGTEARFRDEELRRHEPFFAAIDEAVRAAPQPVSTLCEIGCGAGLLLAHLRARLPAIPRLVGLDLSAAQVERNRRRFAGDARLRFEAGEATRWIAANAQPGWAFLTYGGVFEYFPRAKLQAFLELLATRLQPSILCFVEPLADGHDLSQRTESVVYGCENTWSHNHPALLEAAGFETPFMREERVRNQRWLSVVATSRG